MTSPASSSAYELLARVASGGMGEVYIARKVGSGAFEKRVALKLLLPHLSEQPQFVQMFLDEARIAARMNHPNIVQIFDLGEADGRYFLAMALVEGVSLSQLLRACRRENLTLPLPIVRLIANGLCDALAYAHTLRGPEGEDFSTIHRDVNPSNVLISASGAVLLTDFGIAKAQGKMHATRAGQVMGKLAYIAPEQLRSTETVDTRADIYAAALTLYEVLTGLSPFERNNEAETLDAVRTDALPDPVRIREDVSVPMRSALMKATARNRDERFATIRSFLEAFADGPLATPRELSELVEKLCELELKRFKSKNAPPIASTQTKSFLGNAPTDDATRRSSRRWRWVSFGAAIALGAAAGGVFIASARTVEPVDPAELAALSRSEPVTPPEPVHQPKAEPVTLTAKEATPEPVKSAPPAQKPPAVTRRRPSIAATEPNPARARIGYLSADAAPWADVWVDGEPIGQTPLSRYPMTVGKHEVLFKNPQAGKDVRRSVAIDEGKLHTVRVEFRP